MSRKSYTAADVMAYREKTGCGTFTAKQHFENLERKEFLTDIKHGLENDGIDVNDVKTAVLLLIDMELQRLQ
jgi:hypothetical protein